MRKPKAKKTPRMSARAARAISRVLDPRYGKRPSFLESGVLPLVFGLFLLVMYLKGDVARLSDYQRVEVKPDNVYIHEGRRRLHLRLVSGEVTYEASARLWGGRYEPDELLHSLPVGESVTLWIKPSASRTRSFYGLQNGTVSLNPSDGVAGENDNRRVLLWLALVFTGGGLWAVLHTLMSSRDA